MSEAFHILIVDDDPPIRELLSNYLTGFGFLVSSVEDGTGMREVLAQKTCHLIILDLMLPKEDGLSLCRTLRSTHPSLPIIMLTARGEMTERIVGLELGADDYIVKPFEPRELVARIHALLRRTHSSSFYREQSTNTTSASVRFADWVLERNTRQLTNPQQLVIPLSNTEFRLLWIFIEHPKQVMTRDELMDALCGRSADALDRSIDLLISRLRQKLEADTKNPVLLKTIRGEGYLFDTTVAHL